MVCRRLTTLSRIYNPAWSLFKLQQRNRHSDAIEFVTYIGSSRYLNESFKQRKPSKEGFLCCCCAYILIYPSVEVRTLHRSWTTKDRADRPMDIPESKSGRGREGSVSKNGPTDGQLNTLMMLGCPDEVLGSFNTRSAAGQAIASRIGKLLDVLVETVGYQSYSYMKQSTCFVIRACHKHGISVRLVPWNHKPGPQAADIE